MTDLSPIPNLSFLAAGGEMGALMRALNWSATPLGDPRTWPQSLRTTVGLLLATNHPMFIWWGPELIQFYNDAYRKTMGPERHPSALGQRGRECWGEIWDIIGPQIEQVMAGNGATWRTADGSRRTALALGKAVDSACRCRSCKQQPPEHRALAEAEQVSEVKPRRILVVDDNADAADMLSMVLSLAGHSVCMVNHGLEVLDRAREFRPDIVLLDLGLPGLSGFEIARQLRASSDIKQMTLIALTGYGQDEDRRQSRAHGFDHHVVKPVDLDALSELINRA